MSTKNKEIRESTRAVVSTVGQAPNDAKREIENASLRDLDTVMTLTDVRK